MTTRAARWHVPGEVTDLEAGKQPAGRARDQQRRAVARAARSFSGELEGCRHGGPPRSTRPFRRTACAIRRQAAGEHWGDDEDDAATEAVRAIPVAPDERRMLGRPPAHERPREHHGNVGRGQHRSDARGPTSPRRSMSSPHPDGAGSWQVFGLETDGATAPVAYWPSLPGSREPVLGDGGRFSHRCGTVPDSHRVPCCLAVPIGTANHERPDYTPAPSRVIGRPDVTVVPTPGEELSAETDG